MAEDWQVQRARNLVGWPYPDTGPIRLALTAGDTESQDREGNRKLAQIGDRLIPFIITLMCYQLGVSRQDENTTQIQLQDKRECARRARICHLDALIKMSVRQKGKSPPPVVLKNALYALITAIWMQAQDWSVTVVAMMNLGLVCRRSELINPRQLMIFRATPDSLLDAVMPYLPDTVNRNASADTRVETSDASIADGGCLIQQSDATAGLTESSDFMSASAAATPPAVAVHGQWTDAGFASSVYWPAGYVNNVENLCIGTSYEQHLWDPPSHVDAAFYFDRTMAFDDGTHMQVDAGATQDANMNSQHPISTVLDHASITTVDNSNAANPEIQNAYHIPLLTLSSQDGETLMQIVNFIGTPSAVFSLKLLMENLRELELNHNGKRNATRIGATRSSAERVAAIDDLTISMAHFTLPLRMHIYMLYKDAESEHPEQVEAQDPFVIEMGQPSVRPRGRPENIRKASISQKMTPSGRRSSHAKRWRRVGQRLDLLVKEFGFGVLGLLDERLSLEIILKVTDSVFKSFVEIIDHAEGNRIRHICDRAGAIVSMLFHESGSSYATKFQIENCSESVFEDTERCSLPLAMLLLPTTQDDNTTIV